MPRTLAAWIRTALTVIVAWPFLMAAAAMVGVPALTAAVALLPLAAGACYAVVSLDPTLAAELASNPRVVATLQTVRTVVMVELCLGAYLTFVPVHRKPFLIVQLALVLAILALSQAGGAFLKAVPAVAGLIALAITASFFQAEPNAVDETPKATTPAPRPSVAAAAHDPTHGNTRAAPASRPAKPEDPVLGREGAWLMSGGSIPLAATGGLVSAEFTSVEGEPFVALRLTTPGGGDTVARAVVGGEQIVVGSGRDAVRLEVSSVDWDARRVRLRRTQ